MWFYQAAYFAVFLFTFWTCVPKSSKEAYGFGSAWLIGAAYTFLCRKFEVWMPFALVIAGINLCCESSFHFSEDFGNPISWCQSTDWLDEWITQCLLIHELCREGLLFSFVWWTLLGCSITSIFAIWVRPKSETLQMWGIRTYGKRNVKKIPLSLSTGAWTDAQCQFVHINSSLMETYTDFLRSRYREPNSKGSVLIPRATTTTMAYQRQTAAYQRAIRFCPVD